MAIIVGHWERRDSADLDAFGSAALGYCRAMKSQDGVRASRFFWTSPDAIVVQTEADSPQAFDQRPDAETLKALFALSDLARSSETERWMDPRDGQAAYQSAGR